MDAVFPFVTAVFAFIMPLQFTLPIEYVDYRIGVDVEDPVWPIFEGWEMTPTVVIRNVGVRPLNLTSTITTMQEDLRYNYKFLIFLEPNAKSEIKASKIKLGPPGTYSIIVTLELNEKPLSFPAYNRMWINGEEVEVPSRGFYPETFYVYPILSLITALSIVFGASVPSTIYLLNRRAEHRREAKNQPNLSIFFDPSNNPDYFTPILDFTSPEGQSLNVTRRFLRVVIRNDGEATAELCKATIRIIQRPSSCTSLSGEPKPLRWETGNVYQDIHPLGGEEPLHVAFSDRRVPIGPIPNLRCSEQAGDASLYAWLSTPDGIQNIYILRNQDGLCLGDFEVEISVRPKRGHLTSGLFRIHVVQNWRELSMSRIS